MNTEKDLHEWQDLTIDNLIGGLVLDVDTELMENNQLRKALNVIIRDKKLQRDTGYEAFMTPVRGNPRRMFQWFTPAGAIHEILITDLTVYRRTNNQWRYLSDGTETTISVTEAAGQTVLSVTSIVGFADNDFVGIVLDTGQMHFSQVNGAPGGGTITIDDPLPSQAGAGTAVIKAPVLAGISERHVTGVVLPWDNSLIFTNGVNRIKRYNPANFSVIDMTGLTDTVCQTLALFDNSLIIANTTESGVRFPFRIRYSAKGDITLWTTLEAGTTDILDSSHNIYQLLGLGPYLIAYREGSISRIAIANSSQKRFTIDTTVDGVGIFSNLAAIKLIDRHIVWGNENFFVYKGGFSIEPIENPIKASVFGRGGQLTLSTKKSECFVALLKPVNEVFFFFGITATVKQAALRYHLDYDRWTTRDFANRINGYGERLDIDTLDWDELLGDWANQTNDWGSYAAAGDLYNFVLLASDQDQVYQYDFASDIDGNTVLSWSVETKDFADSTYILTHDYLDIGASGGNITVEYSIDKGNSWNFLETFSAGAVITKKRIFKQFSSRFFRYRFTGPSTAVLSYLKIRFKRQFEW